MSIGACVVVGVEVAGVEETSWASEFGGLVAEVAQREVSTLFGTVDALVWCLHVKLTALDVAEGANLKERLPAMGACRWSRIWIGS